MERWKLQNNQNESENDPLKEEIMALKLSIQSIEYKLTETIQVLPRLSSILLLFFVIALALSMYK